jgi:hypothetical protein
MSLLAHLRSRPPALRGRCQMLCGEASGLNSTALSIEIKGYFFALFQFVGTYLALSSLLYQEERKSGNLSNGFIPSGADTHSHVRVRSGRAMCRCSAGSKRSEVSPRKRAADAHGSWADAAPARPRRGVVQETRSHPQAGAGTGAASRRRSASRGGGFYGSIMQQNLVSGAKVVAVRAVWLERGPTGEGAR